MSIALQSLKPYTSLLVARGDPETPSVETVSGILDALVALLGLDDPTNERRELIQRSDPENDGEMTLAFLHYRENKPPSWFVPNGDTPTDTLNHLIVACLWQSYLALYVSEPTARSMVGRVISANGQGPGPLASLSAVEPAILNAAFIHHEPVRTLWLSGIHRRVPSKPDNKILAGIDLENALNPLSDQSFYFTAARCHARMEGEQRLPVGVSPRRSRIWSGPSKEWSDFRDRTVLLLDHLKKRDTPDQEIEAPLAVLAAPTSDTRSLASAYDVSVLPPEMLTDSPDGDDDKYELMARWAYESEIEVTRTDPNGPSFTARVKAGDDDFGEFSFDVGIDKGKAKIEVTPQPELVGKDDPRKEVLEVCKQRSWLTIRYESGHTISDGLVYSVRHRDVRFQGWEFLDLSNFNVKAEKPTVEVVKTDDEETKTIKVFKPDLIGTQDSLFCWVQKNWPPGSPVQRGWLACDDGSGEIADFIHFDPKLPKGPLVSLIHVKASKSDSKGRQISTSDYEVVVGQAVKNLRSLDRIKLAKGLREGANKDVGSAVWLDGQDKHPDGRRFEREDMAKALEEVGENYRRRVVVIQPRVTASERDRAWKDQDEGKKTSRVARLQQLDTLLIGAEADCHGLQADLIVYGEAR